MCACVHACGGSVSNARVTVSCNTRTHFPNSSPDHCCASSSRQQAHPVEATDLHPEMGLFQGNPSKSQGTKCPDGRIVRNAVCESK